MVPSCELLEATRPCLLAERGWCACMAALAGARAVSRCASTSSSSACNWADWLLVRRFSAEQAVWRHHAQLHR